VHASRRTQLPIGQDQAAVFRNRNKLCGKNRPSRGMCPAFQSFRAGNFSGPQIDFRLVVQSEFLPFEGTPQTLLDGLPLDGPDVHA
jgi:hypothetical protein